MSNIALQRPPIPEVVQQHIDDSMVLHHVRSRLVRASHARLLHLGRIDERISAHLDGLALAGAHGDRMLLESADFDAPAHLFVAGVRSLEEADRSALDRLLAIAEALPSVVSGLLAAFGWVSAERLRGAIPPLLASKQALHREVGLFACRAHRVDPGPALEQAFDEPSPRLRARALRVAGEGGRTDLLLRCRDSLREDDGACLFAAARAVLLLGDRRASISTLDAIVAARAEYWVDALCLSMQALPPEECRSRLRVLHDDPGARRALIRAIGVSGDAHFVPWLFDRMSEAPLARIAGDAFSMITGIDLARDDLETNRPEGFESGPNDDPDDDAVEIDDDDDLPWPDVAKLREWWRVNGVRFTAGQRLLLGSPASESRSLAVLRDGAQRQRWVAACDRALLAPGKDVFPIAAPTWRQRRWLGSE